MGDQSLAPELLTCSGIQSSQSGESNSLDINSLIQEVLSCRTRFLQQFDASNLFGIAKNVLLSQTISTVNSITFDVTVVDAIRELSCKMGCYCSVKNVRETVKEIVMGNNYLSKFDFETRMVISVAAFAVNYGQFRLFVESCSQTDSQVMMNLLVLKQLQFDVKTNLLLVAAIDKLMELVLQMIELALQLIQIQRNLNGTRSRVDQCFAQAFCLTIYTLVQCSSLITAPAGSGIDLQAIYLNFQQLGDRFVAVTIQSLQGAIQSTSQDQNDWNRLRDIFYNVRVPIIPDILIALIGAPTIEEATLVIGCNTTQEVRFDQVGDKNVYLLITGAYTTVNEIKALAEFVKKQKDNHQLIWIPISNIDQGRFDTMQILMNWYTVRHPSVIRPGAIRFIKETCPFQDQTVLVPLCQEKLQFYSIDWLWTRCIFPLSNSTPPPPLPQLLSINYLLSDIYEIKISEIKTSSSPPIICLYGGEDMAWLTSFTQRMREVTNLASASKINMEFIYVSKSHGIDTANQKIFNFFTETKLASVWKSEGTECWRFWNRVESFFREQMRVQRSTSVDIMKQIITLLSYNTNDKGWAVFGEYTGTGTDTDTDTCVELAQATASVAEIVFKSIKKTWFVNSATFVKAVGDEFDVCVKQQLPHHCSHIMLPAGIGEFDDKMITCPICLNTMSNYRLYRCCA